MIKSMTAFGRGEAENDDTRFLVELRTLNHRFLDFHFRLPRRFLFLEDRLRKLLKSRLARGRIELNLTVESLREGTKVLALDRALLAGARSVLEELQQCCAISEPLCLEHFLHFPDLISVRERAVEDEEAIWSVLSQAVLQALAVVEAMRQAEGVALEADLRHRLASVTQHMTEIRQQAALVPHHYQERLRARLADLLAEQCLPDDTRLFQEVALLAERADITEELTRLASHLEQFQETLTTSGPVGRKLDFLLQEMFREINTIGAKAGDLRISQAVVEVKGELERLREQVQNIE